MHARWQTICYHHVKFHTNPPSSLGGDDEQRFGPEKRNKQTNKQTKKDSKKSTKTIKIPKSSESLIKCTP